VLSVAEAERERQQEADDRANADLLSIVEMYLSEIEAEVQNTIQPNNQKNVLYGGTARAADGIGRVPRDGGRAAAAAGPPVVGLSGSAACSIDADSLTVDMSTLAQSLPRYQHWMDYVDTIWVPREREREREVTDDDADAAHAVDRERDGEVPVTGAMERERARQAEADELAWHSTLLPRLVVWLDGTTLSPHDTRLLSEPTPTTPETVAAATRLAATLTLSRSALPALLSSLPAVGERRAQLESLASTVAPALCHSLVVSLTACRDAQVKEAPRARGDRDTKRRGADAWLAAADPFADARAASTNLINSLGTSSASTCACLSVLHPPSLHHLSTSLSLSLSVTLSLQCRPALSRSRRLGVRGKENRAVGGRGWNVEQVRPRVEFTPNVAANDSSSNGRRPFGRKSRRRRSVGGATLAGEAGSVPGDAGGGTGGDAGSGADVSPSAPQLLLSAVRSYGSLVRHLVGLYASHSLPLAPPPSATPAAGSSTATPSLSLSLSPVVTDVADWAGSLARDDVLVHLAVLAAVERERERLRVGTAGSSSVDDASATLGGQSVSSLSLALFTDTTLPLVISCSAAFVEYVDGEVERILSEKDRDRDDGGGGGLGKERDRERERERERERYRWLPAMADLGRMATALRVVATGEQDGGGEDGCDARGTDVARPAEVGSDGVPIFRRSDSATARADKMARWLYSGSVSTPQRPLKLLQVMGALSDVIDERERLRAVADGDVGGSESDSDGEFVVELLRSVGQKVKGGWVLRDDLIEREREREAQRTAPVAVGGAAATTGAAEAESEAEAAAAATTTTTTTTGKAAGAEAGDGVTGQAISLVHSSLVKLTQAAFTRMTTLSNSLSGKAKYLAVLENAALFRRSCGPTPPPASSPFATFYEHSLALTASATMSFTLYTLSKHFPAVVSLFDGVAALLEQGVPPGEVQFHPATSKAVHSRTLRNAGSKKGGLPAIFRHVNESIHTSVSTRTGVADKLWQDFQANTLTMVENWGKLSTECFEGRGVGTHALVTVEMAKIVFEEAQGTSGGGR